MSEIRANTISDAEGTGPATLTGQSAPKAWATTNNNPAIVDSYNISSGNDNGTGDYDLNLTNAMTNDKFSCPANENGNSADMVASTAVSPSAANFDIWDTGANRKDRGLNAVFMGDLA